MPEWLVAILSSSLSLCERATAAAHLENAMVSTEEANGYANA